MTLERADPDGPTLGRGRFGDGRARVRRWPARTGPAALLGSVLLGSAMLLVACSGDGASSPTTSSAPPAPAARQFPSSATTGVPAGSELTPYVGVLEIDVDGAVVDGLEVTGCVLVRANDVTIRNSRVLYSGGCGNKIVRLEDVTDVVVEDSELDGRNQPNCGEALGDAGYTAVRVDAHSCSDGFRVADGADVAIRDSYVHALSGLPGDHGDGIQCYGGRGPITVQHSTIEGGSNAAFMTADGCSGPLLLDDNLFSGGGYPVRLAGNDATVTNNVWIDGAWDYGPVNAYFGGGSGEEPGVTIVDWSGNLIVSGADGFEVVGPLEEP